MRNDFIPHKVITGVAVVETPLGWVVSWKSGDGKCLGKTNAHAKLRDAHAEAHGMVEGTGYELAI
jgi:hypothetical protein